MHNPIEIARIGTQYMACVERGVYLLALKILVDNPQIDIMSLTSPTDIDRIESMLDLTERTVRSDEMRAKCLTVRERMAGLWAYCAACGAFSKINHPVGQNCDLPFAPIGTHVCESCEPNLIVEAHLAVVIDKTGHLL